jgi:hypothetical protein
MKPKEQKYKYKLNPNQMEMHDIVKNSDEVKQSGEDWTKFYAYIHSAIQLPRYRLMRNNNTLFLYEIVKPHEANLISTFNAEKSYKVFARNIIEFGGAMEKAGFYRLTAEGANIQTVTILKSRFPVQYREVGKNKNNVSFYQIEVDIRKDK